MALRRTFLLLHAFVVLGLTGFVLFVLDTYRGVGALVGLEELLIPLLGLGLPWSILTLVDPYVLDSLPRTLHLALFFLPALVNLGIHAALVSRANRRDAYEAEDQTE